MASLEFRYGAFISYRHVDPDRAWAKWLHRELETYRVPSSLRRRGIAPRVNRVFRDEEELAASPALSAAIEDALLQSAFLIVVCSPRTPGSKWVNQEVLKFRELGRADRILALLIEGEPEASFPRALCEVRPALNLPSVSAEEAAPDVEPLAADVRPETGESLRTLRRMAKLKLIATVLGCRFDDLRQRDQERRTRRLSALALALGILVVGVTGLALYAYTQQLRADREARVATAQRLAAQARVHFADRPDLAALLAAEATLLDESPPVLASLLDSLEHDARLLTFLRGHSAPIRSVAFSPDGELLASGGDDGTIRLWNARTWELVAMLPDADARSVRSLAFASTGSVLASGGADQSIRLWNVAARAPIGPPLTAHTGAVRSLVFDRTAKVLFSSSGDESGQNETLRWDLTVVPPAATPLAPEGSFAGNLALAGNEGLLAIGSGQTISLWNSATRQRLPPVLATNGVFLQGLAFSPDGMLLASGDDSGLTLWDFSGRAPKRTQLSDNADFTLEVAISPDGKLLAGGGNDRSVRLWSLESKRQDAPPLAGHTGYVTAVAFHPGGAALVSGSEDATLIVWTIQPQSRLRRHLRHPGRVVSAAFLDDNRLATGSFDGSIALWNLASRAPVRSGRIDAGEPVEQLVYAGERDGLFGCGSERGLRPWNVQAGIAGTPLVQGDCALSAISGSGKWRAELRDSPDFQGIDQENPYTVTISDLQSRPVRARPLAITFPSNRERVAISDGGGFLAVGTEAGGVYVWNVRTDSLQRRELPGHTGRVADLAFSPDAGILASAGHDGTVRLWNVSSGTLQQPPIQTNRRVDRVTFNSTATRLAALYDASLREPPALQLWDVASGVAIGAPVRGGSRWSIGHVVAFSPTGKWIVSGGDDDDILLLDGDVASWRDQACRFANRNLSPTDEWPLYFPGRPYHKTCPHLPVPTPVPVIRHDREEELF